MFEVRDLLKIEEDPEILNFKITELDIPLWLLIRMDLFFYLQMKIYNMQNPHIKVDPFSLNPKKKLEYLFKSIYRHPFIKKQSQILILGASINNILENNIYYNRLYDPFFEILNNNLYLIEVSNKFNYYEPRFIKNVRYRDLIDIFSSIFYKLIFNIDYSDLIKSFKNYLFDRITNLYRIDIKEYIDQKFISLNNYIKKIKIKIFLYNRIISLIKPELIIVEDAHYSSYSYLIKLAKLKGIKVAEFQHGYIGKGHLAYNFHENIKNQIKDYFPDYMLYWGEYWAMNSDIPGEKKIIGFPYLEKKQIDLQNKYQNKDIYILLVSGGNIPLEYVKLGKMLKSLYPDKKLVFRPHPSERPAINERYNELLNNGWEIDNNSLYDTLSKTEICISLEVSTVLYEATVFCKKVFLINSRASEPYLENDFPLIVIKDYNKIYEYIEKNDYNIKNQDIRNKLFEPNWENNFINFINEIGIKDISNCSKII